MSDKELPDDLQRWTAKRRAALVLSILKGETSPLRYHFSQVIDSRAVSAPDLKLQGLSPPAGGWANLRRVVLLQ